MKIHECVVFWKTFNLLELFVIFEVFNFAKPENESELWLWKMIWTETKAWSLSQFKRTEKIRKRRISLIARVSKIFLKNFLVKKLSSFEWYVFGYNFSKNRCFNWTKNIYLSIFSNNVFNIFLFPWKFFLESRKTCLLWSYSFAQLKRRSTISECKTTLLKNLSTKKKQIMSFESKKKSSET